MKLIFTFLNVQIVRQGFRFTFCMTYFLRRGNFQIILNFIIYECSGNYKTNCFNNVGIKKKKSY